MYTCTWEGLVVGSTKHEEGVVMTEKNDHALTGAISSCSPQRISKRKSKIGREITKEILASPEEKKEIMTGLAEIGRGEFIVWKKKCR